MTLTRHERRERWILAAVVAGALALGIGVLAFKSWQESRTYNRLTGAQTTTWDAVWVQLRVQGEPSQ